MRIILNREEIEAAIQKYIKDEILPYGDTRKINVTQERKVSATITFGEDTPERTEPFPEFAEEDMTKPVEDNPDMNKEPERECPPDITANKTSAPTVDNPLGV